MIVDTTFKVPAAKAASFHEQARQNRLKENVLASLRLGRSEFRRYFYSLVGSYRVWKHFQETAENCVELGAGNSRKPGFHTLDMNLASDFPFDLRLGLPFPDHSIRTLYAEHVFEHFCHQDLQYLLRECARCLKPGGVLSIAVPNVRKYIDAYVNKSPQGRERCRYEWGLQFNTPLDYLNYMFYMDGHHKYMFDPDHGVALLKGAGFEASLRDFDPGLDREERAYESLYLEARKSC